MVLLMILGVLVAVMAALQKDPICNRNTVAVKNLWLVTPMKDCLHSLKFVVVPLICP